MGAANKLLADVGGKPMVRHVVEAALASQARPVLVVTGHQADDVRAALAGLDVAFVHQSRLRDGAQQLAESRHPRAVQEWTERSCCWATCRGSRRHTSMR